MEARLFKKVDKHEELTNLQRVDDEITKFMEKITHTLFKGIVLFGVPYLLYILLQIS